MFLSVFSNFYNRIFAISGENRMVEPLFHVLYASKVNMVWLFAVFEWVFLALLSHFTDAVPDTFCHSFYRSRCWIFVESEKWLLIECGAKFASKILKPTPGVSPFFGLVELFSALFRSECKVLIFLYVHPDPQTAYQFLEIPDFSPYNVIYYHRI